MTIRTWDSEIAPRLQRIESEAKWTAKHALTIQQNARQLAVMPDFETKATDELQAAKRELEAALALVNASITELNSKPVAA
jgi:hypothetical protein